jgi:hypothetical protein
LSVTPSIGVVLKRRLLLLSTFRRWGRQSVTQKSIEFQGRQLSIHDSDFPEGDYSSKVVWQEFPEGMALFRAVTAYAEIARVSDACSLAAAFTFLIA